MDHLIIFLAKVKANGYRTTVIRDMTLKLKNNVIPRFGEVVRTSDMDGRDLGCGVRSNNHNLKVQLDPSILQIQNANIFDTNIKANYQDGLNEEEFDGLTRRKGKEDMKKNVLMSLWT